ncbi:MAG TPA: hypothetical protein PK677_14655 [Acidiphilium sp.]|nr:hypothetical protein [Acidiphilium sp.]
MNYQLRKLILSLADRVRRSVLFPIRLVVVVVVAVAVAVAAVVAIVIIMFNLRFA